MDLQTFTCLLSCLILANCIDMDKSLTVWRRKKVSDQNNREYELNINGNRFQISSNCGEEHIRKVERFLDEQISEVNRQTNAYGPTNLAFLVALNLADELLNLRGRLSRYEEVEEGLSRLCERLENVLSSPANSDQNGIALPDWSSRF